MFSGPSRRATRLALSQAPRNSPLVLLVPAMLSLVLYVAGESGAFNAEHVGGQVFWVQNFNSKHVYLLI